LKFAFALTLFTFSAGAQTVPGPPPAQPLPFSHKAHVDANLECRLCHTNPDPGRYMGIMPATECMSCHKGISPDDPVVRTLTALAKKKQTINWVRVYEIPTFVKFSHRTHVARGLECDACHGPVATRNQLAREGNISQLACVECHTTNKVEFNCALCHD